MVESKQVYTYVFSERANTTGYIAIHYSTIAKFLPRKTR